MSARVYTPEQRQRNNARVLAWKKAHPAQVQAQNKSSWARRKERDPRLLDRMNAHAREVYARKFKNNPLAIREQNLKQHYGLTLENYDRLLESQGGCCAICGTKIPGGNGKYFHVDHDHETEEVRGLLCDGCNKGLGHFRDNITVMLKAVEYLKRSRGERDGKLCEA